MKIKVRAKIKRLSEERMELQTRDLGSFSWKDDDGESGWVWTNIAIRTEEISRLIEYSENKTQVELYDGSSFLVAEKFESLFEKWETAEEETITEQDLIIGEGSEN